MVVAIVPSERKIFAPADCVVEMVMDTKHAVGLRTAAGNGLLIHVGIDTVNLQGKYFDVHVSDGQSLKKGDLIMEFDKDKIAGAGYDTSACLIFTEPVEGSHVDREPERKVSVGDRIRLSQDRGTVMEKNSSEYSESNGRGRKDGRDSQKLSFPHKISYHASCGMAQ